MAEDAQLLAIGKQCSHSSCFLVDFLPFKCQHCELPYCQEHFLAKAHHCLKYDETKHNRVAPNCPLCNEPVAIPPGQDPNVKMESHLTTECSATTGRAKTKSLPVCQRVKCGKTLYSPIRCDKCRKQFCPSHRFPSDHSCSPTPVTGASRLLNLNTNSITVNAKSLNAKASAVGAATVDAVKKSIPSSSSEASSQRGASSASTSSKPTSSLTKAFSKTDRRAKAERESRRKALRAREQKGLLSAEEKAVLAAEEDQAAREKKDDCLIM
ncbi:uncharacterized protein EV420DRAFT_1515569 [Desarmillaria tabescens]|uniref:AN1-type domain-containing protein n=1 Tax=Armillaria tabescens TaxID=1929756 RepID=A0AA39NEN1_ARMTA|nr:uncharacterized protein EV420DRAFT_1515569 [Desarmillaria tabescens]KAK0464251.1 hypothetical protein EV420DRAFT_1515569 [Desarmillaria tabescens]